MKQDFLFALRQLRRNARFHLLAAATLALGIGATTAIFSLVSGVLLRPLPFPDAERLVALRTIEFPAGLPLGTDVSAGTPNDNSFPDFLDWRSQNGAFEALATYGWVTRRKFTPGGNGKPQIIEGVHVSSDFFKVLGIPPQYGRSFTRDEERAGTCAVVISHEFWVTEFGGSLERIGGPIRLSDQACTIVGVMPAEFTFPYRAKAPEFWDNIGFYGLALGLADRRDRDSNVIARLGKDRNFAQASAEINSIQRRLAESFPEDRNHSAVVVTALPKDVSSDVQRPVLLLFGSVTGVLLIACVNVAGLLVARGVVRRSEFSVRTALGASAGQIVRQVLMESTILSGAAGIAGAAFAFVLLKGFLAMMPQNLPRLHEVRIDGLTLGFTLAVSLITGVCFGALPAWGASRVDPALALGRGRATSGGRREQRVHGGLVVAEIAISLVLLAGSGLLIRSFLETTRVNPGFEPHGLLTFRLGMSDVEFPHDKARQFFGELRDTLGALPGVEEVTSVSPLPFTYDSSAEFRLRGMAENPSDPPTAKLAVVGPRYFETMKIPLLRGRTFDERDGAKAKAVAMVDEQFAKRFFPGEEAIGKFLQPTREDGATDWYEIVGVVASIRTTDLRESPDPEYFLAFAQAADRPLGIMLRVPGDPREYERRVREAVGGLNRDLPIFELSTMDERIRQSMVYARFEAQLLTAFAIAALLLAGVGVYATLSEIVARRTFEIGVRVALGAHPRDVFQFILQRGLTMAVVGVLLGLGVFWMASRVLVEFLYGISASDPATILVAGAVLLGTAVVASAWPAWRAVRLDPMKALREL
jgi:putative ABC transport system permease protein